MMGERAKPIVLFVYGNDPSPPRIERMHLLQRSGEYDVYMAYWSRQDSPISIPFSSELPPERLIPIRLPDPRGNPLRRAVLTLRFAKAVWSVLRRLKPQVVHTYYPDMLAVARLVLLGRRGTALMYEIPDINEQTVSPWGRLLQRLLLRRTDAVFIHSDRFRSAFLDRYHLVSPRTPIVYSSVCPDSSLFAGFKPPGGRRPGSRLHR